MKSENIKKLVDLKLIGILALAYLGLETIVFLKFLYLRSVNVITPSRSPMEFLLEVCLVDWLLVVIFMSFIAITTKYFFIRNLQWKKVLLIHLLLSFLLVLFVYSFSYLIMIFQGLEIDTENLYRTIFIDLMRSLELNLLVYLGMTGIIYMYYYFYKTKSIEGQKAQLKNDLLDAKYQLLHNQLQPHFLFNALNNISALIPKDIQKAQHALVSLSDLLRELLNYKNTSQDTLEHDLEILEKYVALMELKYYNKFKIALDIEEGLENALVPSLLFQPIVENALKYGIDNANLPLLITIKAYANRGKLQITIKNNGRPLPQEGEGLLKSGKGLSNLKERLEILYPGKNYFSVFYQEVTSEVLVKMVFPLEMQEVTLAAF